ncbi:MAG: FKBP-type peptidyl-prolyl cis-trans isomerase [Cyclobacteriaceae bacterium]
MKEGDKWIVYIPAELGYGERGSGQIPPNSTLIFELELIKVN